MSRRGNPRVPVPSPPGKGCGCEFGSDPRAGSVDLALVLQRFQRGVCWPFVPVVGSELLRVEGAAPDVRVTAGIQGSSQLFLADNAENLKGSCLRGESPPGPLGRGWSLVLFGLSFLESSSACLRLRSPCKLLWSLSRLL